MPTLGEVILNVANKRRAEIDAEPIRELQQMGVLQSILAKSQEQKDAQALRGIVAQAGGDPSRAVEALLKAGTPKSIALAAQLKGLLPKPAEPFTLAPGAIRYGPNGEQIASAPTKTEPFTLSPGAVRYGPDGKVIAEGPAKEQTPSPLGRLIAERDALPAGDPRRSFYDRAVESASKNAGTGTNVTVSPTLQLGKEGSNKVDAGLLDTTKGLMQLSAIEGQFRPEFQQAFPRVGAVWSAWKDKAGVGLSAQDSKFLQDFSSYKRNAINAMNEYIKSITGAAMSEAEAQRILKGMPNPGQGILDGDSPLEFKAKLDDAMKQTRLALARYEYIKRTGGMAIADVPLGKMPQIMNDRGTALEQQIRSANTALPDAQVKARVRQLLAKEFGLVQ